MTPGIPFDAETWVPAFLLALGDKAADQLQLLVDLEHAWRRARGAVGPVRSTSRATAAIDILAAAPVISASSLAAGLGRAVNNATGLLDRFCADGIAIEVTHRTKRRLFGLVGLAPLRDQVAPPRRPEPGRGRGRPPLARPVEPPPSPAPMLPAAGLSRIERPSFDYSDLDAWMAQADQAIRQTRRILERLAAAPHWGDERDDVLPECATATGAM